MMLFVDTPPPTPVQRLTAIAVASDTAARLAEYWEATSVDRGVDAPDWLERIGRRHNDAVAAGHGLSCRHLPDGPQGATMAFAAAWRPGVLVCRRCLELLEREGLDPIGEWTCDACGRYCHGQLKPALAQDRSLIVVCGLCPDCRPPEGEPR